LGGGGGGVARRVSDALEGKWAVRGNQTQEMKGKEGSGDPEGREARSGLASSGRGLDTSGEKGFFADVRIRLKMDTPGQTRITPSGRSCRNLAANML